MRDLSIIYWNIWLELQNGKRNQSQLLDKFEKLINLYNPDFFGLNEVVMNSRTKQSEVINILKSHGYNVHFVPFSNISTDLIVGSALASKHKPSIIKNVQLGPDTQAKRRGYPNQSVSLIHGEFIINGENTVICVNYLGNLIPLDWGTHITHRKNFNLYLNKLTNQNVIVGGDFNEPKFLWTWLSLPKEFKKLTGNIINPTWRLLGKKSLLLNANYDYLLFDQTKDLKLQKFEILNRHPSDHAPLYAKFSLN